MCKWHPVLRISRASMSGPTPPAHSMRSFRAACGIRPTNSLALGISSGFAEAMKCHPTLPLNASTYGNDSFSANVTDWVVDVTP